MATFPCICPPKSNGDPRHPNGDTVTMKPKLDYLGLAAGTMAITVLKQQDSESDTADILARLSSVWLLEGIESWTLTDDKGKAIPVARSTIRAFMDEHFYEATVVAAEGTELYQASVIDPLVKRVATSSPPTPTTDSTSVSNGGSDKPQKRTRRSSITTIPTAGTERMSASPGGGYS